MAALAQPIQIDKDDPFSILRINEPSLETAFRENGFIVLDQGLSGSTCELLCDRLEAVLRGTYDTGAPPDKVPKFNHDLRAKAGKTPPPLGGPSKRTLQVINVWKCDEAFREVVCSPALGELVATLGGWPSGARIANDQVWAKPPGAAALTYHRDSGYFDMVPAGQVITVWIALDDCDNPNVGPLEYAPKSHLWKDATGEGTGTLRGAPAQFFGLKSHTWPMLEAFKREHCHSSDDDQPPLPPEVVPVRVRRGGIGIHDGRTWHGSAQNATSRPRRGLGIHFVPACAFLRDPNGRTHAHRFRTNEQQQRQHQVQQEDLTVPPLLAKSLANSSKQPEETSTDRTMGHDRENSSRELSQELSEKMSFGKSKSNTSTMTTAAVTEDSSECDPCHLPEEYFPITFRGKDNS